MNRAIIVAIELDCSRHRLLTHEYAHADREGVRLCFVRGNLFYLVTVFTATLCGIFSRND